MDAQVRGPLVGANGTASPFTASPSGSSRVNDAHGRLMQPALEGRLYNGGMSLTDISNITFTSATTGATATPIIGLWNPLTNDRYLVILKAYLGITLTALQATGGGPYVWMYSNQNNAITTGNSPINAKTISSPGGSNAKVFAGAALSGMTGTLALLRGSSLCGGSMSKAAFLATQVAMQTGQLSAVEDIDGSIIVPPGSVVGLFATTTPVAHSAVSGITWEEMPINVSPSGF